MAYLVQVTYGPRVTHLLLGKQFRVQGLSTHLGVSNSEYKSYQLLYIWKISV